MMVMVLKIKTKSRDLQIIYYVLPPSIKGRGLPFRLNIYIYTTSYMAQCFLFYKLSFLSLFSFFFGGGALNVEQMLTQDLF